MAQAWKMPPLIKVYEAMGAVGDGRVRIVDEANALVTSSDGSKTYSVYIGDGGRAIASDDNASRWQGYVGYPPIAVLIQRGVLKVPANVWRRARGNPLERDQPAQSQRLLENTGRSLAHRRGERSRSRRSRGRSASTARSTARARTLPDHPAAAGDGE
jgi:hypothetical protein